MAIGKTAPNGTLNADGAFYSVQDVNVLLENAGGGDLPTPTVADAGKAVVVDAEGKYALGEAGGGGSEDIFIVTITYNAGTSSYTADKTFAEIESAMTRKKIIIYMVEDTAIIANHVVADLGGTIESIGGTVVYVVDQGGDNTVLQASEFTINRDNTIVQTDYTSV